jgi:chitin synthase
VFIAESLHTNGLTLLFFLIIPSIDAIKGAIMTNAVCLIPGLLLLTENSLETSKETESKSFLYFKKIFNWCAVGIQAMSLIGWTYVASNDNSDPFWLIPIALIFVSLSWWENFISPHSNWTLIGKLYKVKKDLQTKNKRMFIYLFVSGWKIILLMCTLFIILSINESTHSVHILFTKFGDAFRSHEITVVAQNYSKFFEFSTIPSFTENFHLNSRVSTPILFLVLHIVLTYTCYAFVKFACKICIQGVCFALPINLCVH